MPVNIDEKTLKQIAGNTNASYFRAIDNKSLENIYHEIDKMEKTKIKIEKHKQYKDLYYISLYP